MSTEKLIFSQLFKTELSTQKVELGLLDDFESLFNKANNENEIIGKNLIDSLSKIQSNYQQNRKMLLDAEKLGFELVNKTNDLGLTLPPATLNKVKITNAMITEINGYLTTLDKIKSMF